MAESKTTQPRAYWIDAVRSIACIFVIANHVVMPTMPKGIGMNIFYHYTMARALKKSSFLKTKTKNAYDL